MPSLEGLSNDVKAAGLDAWLVYDYKGNNPVFSQLLGRSIFLTRRAFLFIRPDKRPILLVSRVDATDSLNDLEGLEVEKYISHGDLKSWLEDHLRPVRRIAMEYSPNGELPAMSWVDGGTLDLVRSSDVEVVSSADIFQNTAAVWSQENLASHVRAMNHIVEIKDAAFELVFKKLREEEVVREDEIQEFISSEFRRRGLETDDPPIVAVNGHAGDPHYEPQVGAGSVIERGDWLLIDLWAKELGPEAVFADITWVGFLGQTVPEEHQRVFEIVAGARDAVVEHLVLHGAETGFALDRIARDFIDAAGYSDAFVHRTGHSLSPGQSVHGLGANLDDLETHDVRMITEGLGFTIEPGIYLPDFGVRSEINVFIGSEGPIVTSPVQNHVLTFDI